MGFCIDIATRTVVVTEKSDVDLINSVVVEPILYSELARMFAEEALGTELEGEWVFGATTQEVAEYLAAFAEPGALEVVPFSFGGKAALH